MEKMIRGILVVVVIVLVAITAIVATSGADVVSHQDTDVLELEPAGEGTYTQVDDDTGEIQIILTEENPNVDGDGVNGNAVTDIGPVFTIENVLEQQRQTTVWIDHDSEFVEFYAPGSESVESEEEGVTLQPGDSTTVSLRVDTRGTDEITLESINIFATLAPPAETPDDTDDSDQSTDTPTATPTPSDTDGSKPAKTDSANGTDSSKGTETPNGTDSSTASPTTTSTPTDDVNEEAGFAPWLVAALLALLIAVGSCSYLARRYGYI